MGDRVPEREPAVSWLDGTELGDWMSAARLRGR